MYLWKRNEEGESKFKAWIKLLAEENYIPIHWIEIGNNVLSKRLFLFFIFFKALRNHSGLTNVSDLEYFTFSCIISYYIEKQIARIIYTLFYGQ